MWEPRYIAIVAAIVALAAAVGAYLGYEMARPPSPLVIVNLPSPIGIIYRATSSRQGFRPTER